MLAGVNARVMGDRAVLIDCVSAGSSAARVAEAINLVGSGLRAAFVTGRLTGVIEIVPAARTVLVCCADWVSVQGVLAWVEAESVAGGALTRGSAVANVVPRHGRRLPGQLHTIERGDVAGTPDISDTFDTTGAYGAVHTVDIDVVYDGEDLMHVAALFGVSHEALVAAHEAVAWRAMFGGFAPGFMYLSAEEWPFRLPRLAAPRERVRAGSVALADEFSAVYPAKSPGGWQLIGYTDAELWNLDRPEPALVRPGDTVRFHAVRELVRAARHVTKAQGKARDLDGAKTAPGPANKLPVRQSHTGDDGAAITVVQPGLQTLVQDMGRPGHRAVGVTASGAMDRAALARANFAVGNPVGAAALETVGGGLELVAERDVTVAIAGGAAMLEVCNGEQKQAVPAAASVEVRAGQRIRLAHRGPGIRDYFAVRGGVLGVSVAGASDAGPWLGSRSTDTLSGIGPRPLVATARLSIGADASVAPGLEQHRLNHGVDAVAWDENEAGQRPQSTAVTVLRVLAGPREDWFAPDTLRTLGEAVWTVSSQTDRVGARLVGPALTRADTRTVTAHSAPATGHPTPTQSAELPSEGMVRGAVQVPPDGAPVLFLADHPVTGGYPVVGVVIDADLDFAGQLAPGDSVRFEVVDPLAASRDGSWPAARAVQTPVAGDGEHKPELPGWISCTLEIDRRRHTVRIPGVVAAVLDGVFDGVFDGAPGSEPEPAEIAAARELLASIVRAIRNETKGQ